MIHGTITKEKLTADDFVKYICLPNGQFAVCFMNDKSEQVCSIPVNTVAEAIECADKFQVLFEEAIRKHQVGLGSEQRIIDDFHKLFYDKAKIQDGLVYPHTDALYYGIHTQKNPMDLWIYQEIIHENRPELVVECGTADGGSTLFMAHVMDVLDHGQILSIDIAPPEKRPRHRRITYLTGDTLSAAILRDVEHAARARRTMVILDDDHSYTHVLAELKEYEWMVTSGQYLIVEDTNINGHPVLTGFGPGPAEAVQEFLKNEGNFKVDGSREKFLFTQNPGGFLRRK